VYRASSHHVEAVESPGVWLGILPDASQALLRSELQLEESDVLLLYTDGVLEATNAEREQFGVERLKRKLLELGGEPVDDICRGILTAVTDWATQMDDDLTLVVARREARVAQP